MSKHAMNLTVGAVLDLEQLLDELERLADWKDALHGKIERARWCLNLLLLDGFDRYELEQLKSEVIEFHASCLAWRSEAFK